MILSKFVEFIQLFSTRAVPARPVRRVQLYVLQTHLPDYLNFPHKIQQIHIRFNKFGARMQAISCLPRPPTNLPKRCVWRFYSSILAVHLWGTAPKTAI
jgi:hypothetical protein